MDEPNRRKIEIDVWFYENYNTSMEIVLTQIHKMFNRLMADRVVQSTCINTSDPNRTITTSAGTLNGPK